MSKEIHVPGGIEETIAALLPGESTLEIGYRLSVQCGFNVEDGPDVFLAPIGGRESPVWVYVYYRFDGDEAETESSWYGANIIRSWWMGANWPRLYSEPPAEFVWKMMNKQELTLRTEQGSLVFDVSGLANALLPYRDECKWTEPDSSGEQYFLLDVPDE